MLEYTTHYHHTLGECREIHRWENGDITIVTVDVHNGENVFRLARPHDPSHWPAIASGPEAMPKRCEWDTPCSAPAEPGKRYCVHHLTVIQGIADRGQLP